MTIKVRLAKLQNQAEGDLAGLIDKVDIVARNQNKKGRELVEKATFTTIKNHEAYLKSLEMPASPKFAKEFEDVLSKVTSLKDKAGKPLVSTHQLREEYNAWRQATLKAFHIPSTTQSHKEHTVVGQRCFIVYTHYVKVVRELTTAKADPRQIATFKKFAEVFRRLYMTAQAISRAPDSILGNTSDLDSMDLALDYFEEVTTQAQWEVIKEKEINVLAGKAEQKLVLELKQSQPKRKAEFRIGKVVQDLWREGTGPAYQEVKEKVLRKTVFTKLAGSKVFEDQLVKQTTDLALGKKPKAYKSRTNKVKKALPSKIVKGSLKLKALKKKKNAIKIAALAPAKMSEKGSEQSVRELMKVRTLINKRLPAEVRRNMGRPALINRTGTFSNSVKLETLQTSKNGVSGKYSYMLTGGGKSTNRAGVYETFENTGSKTWSTGYNPKALITKSIRKLAIQYTDKKFTYLRRV